MQIVELFVTRVNRIAEILVIVAYATLILAIPVAVFFRYVLNNSLVWAEELARYLFIWIIFVGAGLGVGKNIHVSVDAVTRKLSLVFQFKLKICVNIGVMGFLVTLIVYGAQLSAFGMENRSMVLGIPMGLVYLAAPVGGFVMLLNVFWVTLQSLVDRIEGKIV